MINAIITISGLEDVLDTLEKVKDTTWMQEACEELAERGAEIVRTKYSLQGNGNDDFNVYTRPIEDGYAIVADGEDIGFLEFGAGVFTEEDDFASEVDFDVYPGSWSESHEHSENPNARYFAKNGFWWYRGIRYTGLVPKRGMQEALDWITVNYKEVIDRKFNEWINAK